MMHYDDNVVWHDGLLMLPQLMQAQARYHDAQLHQRLSAIAAHAWGVVNIHYDDALLATGTWGVQSAEIVMPSGLIVLLSAGTGADAAPLTVQLDLAHARASAKGDGTRLLDVYIGVARARDGLANVATDGIPQKHQRYRSRSRVMAEQTFGQTAPVAVLFAQPHVQLLGGHQLSSDMEYVHIAQLELSAQGTWRRRQDFAPAALRLHQHAFWVVRIEGLVRRLRGAHSALAPAAQMMQRSSGAQTPLRLSDVENLLQLRALHAVIGTLEHVLEDRAITPREAFLCLKQALVAGAPLLPAALPSKSAYLHTDQSAWLSQLVGQLEAMAPSLRVSVLRIPAERAGAERWQITVPPQAAAPQVHIMLEVAAPKDSKAAAIRWMRQAKIAAPAALEHLVRAALTGIDLLPLDVLPDGMHAKVGHIYLSLDVAHDGWHTALKAGRLGIAPPKGDDMQPVTLLIAQTQKTELSAP